MEGQKGEGRMEGKDGMKERSMKGWEGQKEVRRAGWLETRMEGSPARRTEG